MGWNNVTAALKVLIDAVPDTGRVHDYIRWSEENIPSTDFESKFVDMLGTGKRVRFWMASRTAVEDIDAPDADHVVITRHTVLVEGFLGHNDAKATEKDFQEVVDAVMAAFRDADRTLTGLINTYSLPKFTTPRSGAAFQGIACHYARGEFVVEEVSVRNPWVPAVEPAFPVVLPNPDYYFPISAIADALVQTVTPAVVPYVVPTNDKVQFYRGIRPDPLYPANPRVDCPRIRLRLTSLSADPVVGRAGSVADSEFLASFWIYLLQIPGVDHQRHLSTAVSLVSKPFIGNFQPVAMASIPNLVDYGTVPVVSIYHPEINHPLGDPALRVSVAEVQFKLTLRVRIC
jgi:hypothetical protein